MSARLGNPVTGIQALRFAGRLWFVVAVTGQWIFAAAVAVFYGSAAYHGDFARWNQKLPHGYVPGETLGNLAVAAHLLFAVVILVCGPLQFIQSLRTNFPRVHRWNGRAYLVTVCSTALIGAFMILNRGTVGDSSMQAGFFFDALLVLGFAAMAWKCARERDFAAHRVWALRLFLVANAVWFFRVGLMFWVTVNQGPVGFDKQSFTGPFLTFLAFAQTLLPLAVLELSLYAERQGSSVLRILAAGVLLALTGAMAFGIFVASYVSWLPRITGAA